MLYIEAFWQVADGDDWAPAFLRAQQAVIQRGGQSTPFELRFHAPRVYTFHDYAEVISAVELKGERADAANLPQLYFPDGHGLRTHFLGSYQPDLQAGSQLVIDGLWLKGNRAVSGYTHHGIYVDTGFDIRNTRITNFSGDGLHVEATNSIQRPGGGFANAHLVWFQDQRDGATYSVTIMGQRFQVVAGMPAVATNIITALVNAVNGVFPRTLPAVITGPPWAIRVELALLNTQYTVQING